MGMFSYRCRGCGHPLLSHGTTNDVNDWMRKAVALFNDGESRIVGEYDGYGRIDDCEDVEGADLWHHKCWVVSGKPEFKAPARNARGQGFIQDPGDHDMPEPKTAEDVVAGNETSDLAEKKVHEMWARAMSDKD
jgi:hypothetical protein